MCPGRHRLLYYAEPSPKFPGTSGRGVIVCWQGVSPALQFLTSLCVRQRRHRHALCKVPGVFGVLLRSACQFCDANADPALPASAMS
eukprot:scaffold3276_cov23-Tisochrysis_lutea.AAC.2